MSVVHYKVNKPHQSAIFAAYPDRTSETQSLVYPTVRLGPAHRLPFLNNYPQGCQIPRHKRIEVKPSLPNHQ